MRTAQPSQVRVTRIGATGATPPGVASQAVDLSGLDYENRRRRLFAALDRLRPGQELQVTSCRAEDVYWLRYEMEARTGPRYHWS